MNTYKLGDMVLLTDTDESGQVAKIIELEGHHCGLEFADGGIGWYAMHEFEEATA